VMTLAATFLGERLTARRLSGFAVALTGMILVSLARTGEGSLDYPLLVAIVAVAPLCWSIYSVVSKPLTREVSPLVWTYTGTAIGSVMVLPLLPGEVLRQWSALDLEGWLAVGYLSLPCTVLGFALWTWLLQQLPATSVGFTVFLNPPLTLVSKLLLSLAFLATFLFVSNATEWIGGAIVLGGLAIAIWRPRRRLPAAPAPS